MSLLGRMFGNSGVGTVVKEVAGVLDEFVYTDQEQASDKHKAKQQLADNAIRMMEATKGQNLARRFLAVGLMFAFFISTVITLSFGFLHVWAPSPEIAERAQQSAEFAAEATGKVGILFGMVISFYFLKRTKFFGGKE